MKRWSIMAIGVALVVLSGCSSLDREVAAMRAKAAPSASERETCRARGGSIQGVGMFGMPACVTPYTDAGKSCSTKSDCEGRCLLDLDGHDADDRPPATPQCEKTDQTFGCFAEVIDGKPQPGMCVD